MTTKPPTLAELRARLDRRPETAQDFICEAVSTAVANSLADGGMEEHLRDNGWVLVHAFDGPVPDAPVAWLQDGLEVAEPGWTDPVGQLERLWKQAWIAGRQATAANSNDGGEACR